MDKMTSKERYQQRKAEAREEAIDWQCSDEPMSWAELLDAQAYFRKLGTRYGLLMEFCENGIF